MLRAIELYFALTAYSLRTLTGRLSSTFSAVFGIAGVVAVILTILSMGEGFRQTMSQTGSDDIALIMRSGSNGELSSGLSLDDVKLIREGPGIARDGNTPLVSGELFVLVSLPRKSSGTDANVPLRGLEAAGPGLRKNFKITQGRNFEPGRDEVIVGERAVTAFGGLGIGETIKLGEANWTVVGHFSTGGSVSDTELWADARVLQPAYNRGSSFQSVRARLTGADALQELVDGLKTDPRLDVSVQRESDFYAAQSGALTTLVTVIGGILAVGMGLGAAFGAFNTMYTAVSSRLREIATLRAIGFPTTQVLLAILSESIALAIVGGMLGAGAAYVVFNGYEASTLNFQSFSQVAFAFHVSPKLIIEGIVYAIFLGLIGGLVPSLHAIRMPIATGLRET
jgi:putative ABC transport system permease protein